VLRHNVADPYSSFETRSFVGDRIATVNTQIVLPHDSMREKLFRWGFTSAP
jgi:hypothetical protein